MSLRRLFSSFKKKGCCTSGKCLYHLPCAPSIVLMVLPPEGTTPLEEAAFTSQLDKCASALSKGHSGHYMVHNVSRIAVPSEKFRGSIVGLGMSSNFSAGHHAPSVSTILSLGRAVQSWLLSDAEHVAVILADAEQAAIVGATMAAYCGFIPRTQERLEAEYDNILEDIGKLNDRCRRFLSHKFFMRSWCDIGAEASRSISSALLLNSAAADASISSLASSASSPPSSSSSSALPISSLDSAAPERDKLRFSGPWHIQSVLMRGVPRVEGQQLCRPFVMLIQQERVLYSGLVARGGIREFPAGEESVEFPVNVAAFGDLILRVYHLPVGRPGIQLCSVAFHSSFMNVISDTRATLRITAGDIDETSQYPGRFPLDFELKINFSLEPPRVPSAPPAEVAPPSPKRSPLGGRRAPAVPVRIQVEERQETSQASALDTSNDEALARALQEQFEREVAAAGAARQASEGGADASSPAQADPSRAADQLRADEELARQLQEELNAEGARDAVRALRQQAEARRAHRAQRHHHHHRHEHQHASGRGHHHSQDPRRRPPSHPDQEPVSSSSSDEDAGPDTSEALVSRLESLLLMESFLNVRGPSVPRSRHLLMQRVSSLPIGEVIDEAAMADKECQVCLAGYSAGDKFKTLPCLHFYHAHCIDPWLQTNTNCPICQTRIDVEMDASSLS